MVTSFWHALGFLDPGTEHLLGRYEEDPVPSLSSIHHAQLVHQKAGAAFHVLPPHLGHRQLCVSRAGVGKHLCSRAASFPSSSLGA